MHSSLNSKSNATNPSGLLRRSRWACLTLVLLSLADALPATARPITLRRLERPEAQRGLPSSASYVERSLSLSSPGTLEFDFFVDSEEEHDFLDLEVDGVVKFRASGASRGGSAKVPLTAGTHQLRFSYTKDAQGSFGEDTAWIDRIRVLQGREVLELHTFGESSLGAPAGFQAGGTGGGFEVQRAPRKRALRRPIEGAFLGYRPGHTVSSVQRTFEWPAGSRQNELLLSYYLDSEENFDYLRVYVDGQERFAVSGRDRTGRQRIDVGGAGPHTIEIAYDKDASQDVGTDDVRILDLQATSEFGAAQLGGFESAELGTLPGTWSVGAHATGGLTFTVGHEPAPRTYAEVSTADVEPEIDGVIGDDYDRQSIVKLPNLASSSQKPGELWLETQTTGKRFLALRLPRGTGAPAVLTLALDQGRHTTLAGTGCGAHGSAPDASDRLFRIELDAGWGEASTITQRQGACGAGVAAWTDVTEESAWVVEAIASEPPEDPGFVHLELKLVAPPEQSTDDFGLALRWEQAGYEANLPRLEGAAAELDDAAGWETIRYAPVTEIARVSLLNVDGQPQRRAD